MDTPIYNTNNPLYKIMVFSWNTESVGLCETMDINLAEYNRTSCSNIIPGLTTWKYQCNIPDFYPCFAKFITDNSPDLVVIGFQEDRYPGSYFHSHFLITEMPKIGYDLVKRTKLMGVGITSYKGALKGDLFERGIRVSIYAKKDLVPLIEKEEVEMRAVIGNDGQDEYVYSSAVTRGKGATVSYIILPKFGRIAFICCHLPFNARSLIIERLHNNKILRQNEINQSNICFNNIIENLVLFKDPMPTHVIYFGDFNYRLADPRPASEVAHEFNTITNSECSNIIKNLYIKYDELKEQMRRKNIYEFREGIDNQGPIFIPTCKMSKNRPNKKSKPIIFSQNIYPEIHRELLSETNLNPICNNINENFVKFHQKISSENYSYSSDTTNFDESDIYEYSTYTDESTNYDKLYYWKTGCKDQRVPSWCDRILYQKFYDKGGKTEKNCNIICTYYDRFDVGIMSKSDHAGVLSIFELYQ